MVDRGRSEWSQGWRRAVVQLSEMEFGVDGSYGCLLALRRRSLGCLPVARILVAGCFGYGVHSRFGGGAYWMAVDLLRFRWPCAVMLLCLICKLALVVCRLDSLVYCTVSRIHRNV
ncbi:unnamed protein product [Rhodiola kirilowii]